MSVFTQETPEGKEAINYVEKLVEQKGSEAFKDIQTIAKSKLESDAHIAQLENQLKEMREDLQNRPSEEEIKEMVKKLAGDREGSQSQTTNTAGMSEDVIKSLLNTTLDERETMQTAQSNIQKVEQALAERFGETAKEDTTKRLAAIGMSLEEGMKMAESKPDAFLTLVGAPAQKQTNSQMQTEVNSTGMSTSSTEQGYSYWQKLRKENPSLYYTPKMQLQMGEARARIGPEFYDK